MNKEIDIWKVRRQRLNDYKRIKGRAYGFIPSAHEYVTDLKRKILQRKHPFHLGEGYQPFFIVGAGRSGTTLMRRMLLSNGKVHIPPETDALRFAIQVFKSNRNHEWRQVVQFVLSQLEYNNGFEVFNIKSLGPLCERLSKLPRSEQSLSRILNEFYRFHAEAHGINFQVWGDKTPRNSYILHSIIKIFPGARIVHLLRDGVDVVYSNMKAGLRPELLQAGGRWLRSVGMVQEFNKRHPESVITIRYEDMVTYPSRTLQLICDFIGVPFDEAMIRRVDHLNSLGDHDLKHHANLKKDVFTESIGKGRRNLSIEDKRVLCKLIGPELSRFGYEPVL